MTPRKLPLKSRLAAGAAALALIGPASASAGVLVASATDCATQTFSQPFLPFGDVASYTLDPGGDFESGPAWSGGTIVSGNEPYNVGSASDSHSLALSAGQQTVSPSICVSVNYPDIRLFAKGDSSLAQLNVEVLYEDAGGNVQSLPIGTLAGTGSWTLTPPYVIGANLLPLLPGNNTAVAFRFTAASGNWQLDDVYVDPYTRW